MRNRAVKITRNFFYLLAAFWFVVGIGFLTQGDSSIPYYLIAGLIFASIFVFIALGANITKKPIYWLAVIFLVICIILTIADEFGLADFVGLILLLIPLVIMLSYQKEFFKSQEIQ
jgi:hypothetical protein